MTLVRRLDDTWLKAASLGCLWASAEIVLGGFLHNLRIPMVGFLMAAIGIILMIAVGHLWPVRGLFWRAGLVCALMKALAPSAVILGPMIAITCQACLMELSVRVFRRNAFAYLLGGMLAMSWNMTQVLVKTLLSYGTQAINLYLALIRWSEKTLGLAPGGRSWMPIILMFVMSLAAGLAAGGLGLLIGRRAAAHPLAMSSLSGEQIMNIRFGRPARAFPYSFGWLAADLTAVVLLLILVGNAPWLVWLPAGLLAIIVWVRRYADAVRPLLRPRFWIWFILLTALSGALLASLKSGWAGLWAGIAVGLTMNFRAAVLVVGFSALGIELRSPKIGARIFHGRVRQLPVAMEAAVETLPLVMANLPKVKDVFHSPIAAFHRLVAQSDFWLKRLTLRQARRRDVLLLSGPIGVGKSTALQMLADALRADGRNTAGILSPAVVQDGNRIGYDLVDLSLGRRTELSRISGMQKKAGSPSVGRFTFNPEGLRAGQAALSLRTGAEADVIIVDEVGPWELRDQGWAEPLYKLTLETDTPMVWAIRSDILDQVQAHWALYQPRVVDVSATAPEDLLKLVREWLDGRKERDT